MGVSWTTVIKCVWVSVALFLLATGLGACLFDAGNDVTPELLHFVLMLSFPAGPFVLLLGATVIDPGPLYPALDFSLL